jgi:hypothetical protein
MQQDKNRMKWFVTIMAALILAISTIYRSAQGLDADKSLCTVFVIMGGFVWGANAFEYIKNRLR